ncbi:MAG: hypothetical protein K0S28_1439 [Paucimonas sp.]|jgi:hypothetical protein|nr:hypothetical protein [Paucimonas sp.]
MHEIENSPVKRRSLAWPGVLCVVLSVTAILLSLGMPGVGWIMAVAVLILCSVGTPRLNKRYLAGSLAVSVLHLFSFGPLTILGGATSMRSWPPVWFVVLFVALPLGLAVIMLLPGRRQRRNVED